MFISVTSGLNSELPPTIANAVWQALIWPFFDSSGVSLESHSSTFSCRQPMPPLALMYFSKPFRASTLPWKRPGASGEPVSAITWMVIVSAVTPVSVASNVTPSHAALRGRGGGVPPPSSVGLVSEPLRPQAAATRPNATSRHSTLLRFTVPPCGVPIAARTLTELSTLV